MTSKTIKRIATGLLIVAATVLGAKIWFPVPTSLISIAPTADEIYQEELAVAQRTCDKVNLIIGDGTVEGPFTAEECIEPNRSCARRWGPHAVWSGAADGDNVPICGCDEGYIWQNTDGTTGTSYGPVTLDTISALGKCVARSQ